MAVRFDRTLTPLEASNCYFRYVHEAKWDLTCKKIPAEEIPYFTQWYKYIYDRSNRYGIPAVSTMVEEFVIYLNRVQFVLNSLKVPKEIADLIFKYFFGIVQRHDMVQAALLQGLKIERKYFSHTLEDNLKFKKFLRTHYGFPQYYPTKMLTRKTKSSIIKSFKNIRKQLIRESQYAGTYSQIFS